MLQYFYQRRMIMGLDGISINQLRVTQENSPSEINRNIKTQNENNPKIIDGLSQGQRVDPNKDREHNSNDEFNFEQNEQQENKEDDETNESTQVIKYDLSQSNKYELKIDDNSNTILIIEKATQKTVEKIDAQELSNYVHFLSNSQGSIVNRKF